MKLNINKIVLTFVVIVVMASIAVEGTCKVVQHNLIKTDGTIVQAALPSTSPGVNVCRSDSNLNVVAVLDCKPTQMTFKAPGKPATTQSFPVVPRAYGDTGALLAVGSYSARTVIEGVAYKAFFKIVECPTSCEIKSFKLYNKAYPSVGVDVSLDGTAEVCVNDQITVEAITQNTCRNVTFVSDVFNINRNELTAPWFMNGDTDGRYSRQRYNEKEDYVVVTPDGIASKAKKFYLDVSDIYCDRRTLRG